MGTGDPIGIFDSGIGGLTVVKQLLSRLPAERIIYFGDTARVPYGSKSIKAVRRFALQNSDFLAEQGVKIIVVACNTASSVAMDVLKERFSIPVIGVIEPGARAAARRTINGRIGIIGTYGTISSGAYQSILKEINPDLQIFGIPCPLFVPVIEEGWENSRTAEIIAGEYLSPLKRRGIDTLILGCTHYPMIKATIEKVLGAGVALIDSAVEIAEEVTGVLESENLLNKGSERYDHNFYVSDLPMKFKEIATRFL
ncbi:MAG: glutamate racemase, partial [Fidelibacterota bacterium]